MLIINETYAIKNDGLCYNVCKRPKFNPKKPDAKREYITKWYLNTFAQAVAFLVDRAVVVPRNLELLADEIESLKKDIEISLQNVTLKPEPTKKRKKVAE